MEIRYGPSTIIDMDDINFWGTASAGLSSYRDFYDFTSNFLWANGDASNPDFTDYLGVEYDSLQVSTIFTGIDSWPSDGQVYRFGYNLAPIIDIDELDKNDLSVFPNPATEYIDLRFSDEESRVVTVYDINGKLVIEHQCSSIDRIDILGLNSGIYHLRTDKGERVKIVVK